MARRSTVTEASAAARGNIRIPLRRANWTSGLFSRIAVDTTTVSAVPTFDASCPTYTSAPSARSAARTPDSLASLPETGMPRARRIRAMPLMPAPPTPTKWTRPSFSAGTTRSGGETITGSTSDAARAHGAPDHRYEAIVGVATTEISRCHPHGPYPGGVTEQGDQLRTQPLRRQFAVGNEQPAAGPDGGLGIEPLLTVAVRERDIDGRQADGGQFGAGDGAGAAHGDVGRGIGQVHPVDVRHRDVALAAAEHPGVRRTHGMQHLGVRGEQVVERGVDGLVDPAGSLAAAEGEHGELGRA